MATGVSTGKSGLGICCIVLMVLLSGVTQAAGGSLALPWEGSWGVRFIIPTTVWPDELDTYDASEFASQFNQLTSSDYVFVNVSHPASGKAYTSPNPDLVAALDAIVDANPLYNDYFSAYYDPDTQTDKRERFANRDVLGETLDLIDAAGKKAIVYLACEAFSESDKWGPPWMDYIQSQGLITSGDGVREFIVKYYAQKFGNKIDGWWFDGANQFDDTDKQEVKDAVHSGNPNAICSFGVHPLNDYKFGHPTIRTIAPHWSYDYNYQRVTDVEAGNWVGDDAYPVADTEDGYLQHLFMAMQVNWTAGSLEFPAWQAVDWCSRVVDAGGMFSWSIPRDTGLSKMLDPQFQVCRMIDAVIGGTEITYDRFESGFGNWIDGGTDCSYYTGPNAYKGAIELRDNTSSSVMSTGDLPLSGTSAVVVEFAYYPTGMDSSTDDFRLQISTNGGASYTTVEEWNLGDEFDNDQDYRDAVFIEGYGFNDQTRLRFLCDTSDDTEYVYIDNVRITAKTTNPPSFPVDPKPVFICDPIIKYFKDDAKEGYAYEDYVRTALITGSAVDGNGDPLTYSKVAGPAWLTIAPNGYLSGTPGAGDVGVNTFTVQVDDGTGNTTTATLIITVEPNYPVSFEVDPINVSLIKDTAISFSIAVDAIDPESDPITFSKDSGPAWLTVNSDGTLSGTPTSGELGLNTFTVQAVSTGGSDTATLNVTVLNPPDYIYEAEDALWGGDVKFGDDGSGYTGTGYANYVKNSNDYVEWTVNMPSSDEYVIAFRYKLADYDENRPLEIKVNGQVVDAALSFPGSGTEYIYTGPLYVTLNAGNNTVRATAIGSSGANTDHLAIFNTVNDPPSFTVNPFGENYAIEDAAYSGTIADNASDPEDEPMTFSKESGPAWLTVAENGALSGTPSSSDIGLNIFTVQVVDPEGASDMATLNIAVLDSATAIDNPDVYIVIESGNADELDAMTGFLNDKFAGRLGTITSGSYETGAPPATANDLVIIMRALNNGAYDDSAAEVTGWNSLAAPILMISAFQADDDNLGWITSTNQLELTSPAGAETLVTSDPLFDGVTVTGGYADLIVDGTAYKANPASGFVSTDVVDVVASTDAGAIVLARIAEGSAWASTNPASGTHGGDRIVFHFHKNPASSNGLYDDLTADGQIVLENAIDELLPTPVPGNNPPSLADPINEIDATELVAYSSTLTDDASDPHSDPMNYFKVS
ncbi:MAG: putative Ig domain-containing protein, partial [Planctomycetota bacterium]